MSHQVAATRGGVRAPAEMVTGATSRVEGEELRQAEVHGGHERCVEGESIGPYWC
jgi:hypothetical protein